MNDMAFGPCAAHVLLGRGSYYCSGTGTAKLDPAGIGLDLVVMCPECTEYRRTLADLAVGEVGTENARVIELDRIYGMGAAA